TRRSTGPPSSAPLSAAITVAPGGSATPAGPSGPPARTTTVFVTGTFSPPARDVARTVGYSRIPMRCLTRGEVPSLPLTNLLQGRHLCCLCRQGAAASESSFAAATENRSHHRDDARVWRRKVGAGTGERSGAWGGERQQGVERISLET